MKKTLYLLSGLPGSGKSTWARQLLESLEPETAAWVSRDMIRFAMIKNDEDYFSHEDEVFENFIKGINAFIKHPFIQAIIVDATHLNDKSRNKVLSHLELNPEVEVINAVFDVPLQVCLQRNAGRTGRARVSDNVIKRMNYTFSMPNNSYKTIIINEKGEVKDA